jgi:DNA invertase Pin-like site-specific DNA recombinase
MTSRLVDAGVPWWGDATIRCRKGTAGIAKAKAQGKYKGRPASIEPAAIAELEAQGLGASAIAKRLGIGRASVY